MTETTEMLLVVESHTRPPSSFYTPAFGLSIAFMINKETDPPPLDPLALTQCTR